MTFVFLSFDSILSLLFLCFSLHAGLCISWRFGLLAIHFEYFRLVIYTQITFLWFLTLPFAMCLDDE
jgi:hypothetical protein